MSTGYALAKLSDSFKNIVSVIGAQDTDTGTVRKRVADLEKSVNTLTGGNTSSINDVVNKINRIEQELSYSDKVTDWVTWVDALKAFDKGTNVRKYIDDINDSLTGRINSKADSSTVGQISGRVGTLETTVGDANSGLVQKVNTNSSQIANLNNTKADKNTVTGISDKVTSLQNTVGADDAHGLRGKIAELNSNKASASTVSSLLSVVYPNGNTASTSYIQAYALPAYNIAWANKTAIENLKTSGISATRMVDADGNGILVFKSLSTS